MIKYFRESFARKKARRVTQHYPARIETINLEKDGELQFGFWSNPLAPPIQVTQKEVDFFRKFVKEGDLVIDIGANVGDTTVPMGVAAGKTGLTLGFDPNPYVFKVLEKNASLNQEKTNIIPLLNAIAVEHNREFYYTSSEASFANGGISPTSDGHHGKFVAEEKVKGVNLLTYLKENHADRLDKLSFIKIDTEGYDKEIIKSIPDLIEQYKPVIVAESFGKSSNEAKMELFEVIAQHDYDIFYFEDFDLGLESYQLHSKEEMTKWAHTVNIYCVPNK